MIIPRDRVTVGTFQAKRRGRRGGSPDNWIDVAVDVEMYLTPRRPSSRTSRPEIEFNESTAFVSQWYWCRPIIVNPNLRIGHRLVRDSQPDLFIIQNDVLGHVQQRILSIREASR